MTTRAETGSTQQQHEPRGISGDHHLYCSLHNISSVNTQIHPGALPIGPRWLVVRGSTRVLRVFLRPPCFLAWVSGVESAPDISPPLHIFSSVQETVVCQHINYVRIPSSTGDFFGPFGSGMKYCGADVRCFSKLSKPWKYIVWRGKGYSGPMSNL